MKETVKTTSKLNTPTGCDSCDSNSAKLNKILQFINFIDYQNIAEKYSDDDLGFSQLFADTFSRILRYIADEKMWRYYDGTRWVNDVSETFVEHCGRLLVEHLKESDQSEIIRFRTELSKRSKRSAMIQDARSINPLRASDFDSNPYLINTSNCTFDLKGDSHREHSPDDLLTKIANVHYKPDAKCNRWLQFIDEIMCEDKELSAYLQRTLGYALSGDTSKECLFIFWGSKTRNGKGTLMETTLQVMGDYAKSLSPASLSMKSRSSDTPSPEFAGVAGVRLVTVSEPDKGMKLNVALAKRLTGGDPIIARYLHRNPIEYRPQFKIFINTNHLLEIDDDTIFTSGRINMVPFENHFEESKRDSGLKDTFKKPENASAIFNWLLEGYQLFKRKGLIPPKKAKDALITYRKECDTVSLFIESNLVKCDDTEWIKTSVLYNEYKKWFVDCDIEGKSQKEFIAALRQKGLLERHRTDGHIVKGFKLKEEAENDSQG